MLLDPLELSELGLALLELLLGLALELPLLEEPLAACSRWHCSSAAPVRPVHSGLDPVAPVDEESPAVPVDDDTPLEEGDALLDEDGEVPLDEDGEALLPPEALSAPDDPEVELGLLVELLLLGLLDELSDALDPVPLELLP